MRFTTNRRRSRFDAMKYAFCLLLSLSLLLGITGCHCRPMQAATAVGQRSQHDFDRRPDISPARDSTHSVAGLPGVIHFPAPRGWHVLATQLTLPTFEI